MKIRFNLSEDLYLLVDWDSPILPQKGESIKLGDFIEKDYQNLYYGFKQQITGLTKNRFKSCAEWEKEDLFANERDMVRKEIEKAKGQSEGFLTIISAPQWERKEGEISVTLYLPLPSTLRSRGIRTIR